MARFGAAAGVELVCGTGRLTFRLEVSVPIERVLDVHHVRFVFFKGASVWHNLGVLNKTEDCTKGQMEPSLHCLPLSKRCRHKEEMQRCEGVCASVRACSVSTCSLVFAHVKHIKLHDTVDGS